MTNDSDVSVRIVGDADEAAIDRYELASARRALRLMKGTLGSARLHDLVAEQVATGNAFFRDHVRRSGGEQATGTITVRAQGLAAAEFSAWMLRAFAREDVLIAAQPEHYLMTMTDPRGPHVVETLGDHVVGFFMGGWEESEVAAAEPEDADARRSVLVLDDDGTVFGSVATRFVDALGGMDAELSVSLPITSAPAAVDQHLQHFSVEFRSWMLRAAAEIARSASSS